MWTARPANVGRSKLANREIRSSWRIFFAGLKAARSSCVEFVRGRYHAALAGKRCAKLSGEGGPYKR